MLEQPTAGQAVTNQQHSSLPLVIVASSLGTMIEWYDFFIFGSLTAVLSSKFYPPENNTFALIAYLATFAVGFVVRPFGALFFGRIGDLIGRKYAFLVTLTIMGGATFSIGLMPTFATAGWFSPITLIVIRILQGLALGGEYGGAAVYVAEHVSDSKRGLYTSIIQVTAILGLLISLLIILATQFAMPGAAFNDWGWRIPFLVSFFLVGISIYIRLKLRESPIFVRLKNSGKTSLQPLTDAFTKWPNLKQVLLCLFGLTAGQGVIAYTGEFYSLFYMQSILKVNPHTANVVMAIVLALSLPVMLFFGILSDKISRKWIMLAGCLLGVLTYIPIYHAMQSAAGNNVVTVKSRRNPVTGAINLTPMTADASGTLTPAPEASHPDLTKLVFLIFVQMIYVSMVYGPVAAYLVEAFPANIRYTSLSLPYHIGNGIFGGLLPVVGLAICAATGKIYAGLYYPMAVAALTFLFGAVALPETHGNSIWEEVDPR